MFWRKKIKELKHTINCTIDQSNSNVHKINYLEIAMKKTKDALNELENHSKNKWEATTKRIETCEKAQEMFLNALNEQRNVIGKIVRFLNNSSKTKTTTKSKKGAK